MSEHQPKTSLRNYVIVLFYYTVGRLEVTDVPSSENESVSYLLLSVILLAVLLVLSVCVGTVAVLVCLVKRKCKPDTTTELDLEERHEDGNVTYEEIDEFCHVERVDTSKNVAYSHVNTTRD